VVTDVVKDHTAFTYMVRFRYHGLLTPKDEGMAKHPRRL